MTGRWNTNGDKEGQQWWMDGNKVANNWHKLKLLTKVNSLNVKLVENEKGGGCMFLLCCVHCCCIVELQTKSLNDVIAAKRIGICGCCDRYNHGSNKKIARHARETQIQLTGRAKIHVAEHGRIRFNSLCKNMSIVLIHHV